MWHLAMEIQEVRTVPDILENVKVFHCNCDLGPLIVRDGSCGRFNLIGLTSFGALRGCAISGVPTVFTRVSSFRDWILMNIA